MSAVAALSPSPVADPAAKVSMTSKEWVIPPRPKPGRKPAVDIPPTKRKAQNRAAQRAFRERRAARVGELEDQLDHQKDSHDRHEADMKAKICDLEIEVQSFKSRCLLLESMLDKERQERIKAETWAERMRRQHGQHSPVHSADQLQYQLPTRQNSTRNHATSPSSLKAIDLNLQTGNEDPSLTCGNCSIDGPCACADILASVNDAPEYTRHEHDLKRPASPSSSSHQKRHRLSEPDLKPSLDTFNNMQSLPKENCGFCEDGTYCVCAEAENAALSAQLNSSGLPSIIQQQIQTPPPSEADVVTPSLAMEMTADGAVKLPTRKRLNPPLSQYVGSATFSRGCGPKGPGTCTQCQADPKSGLFCRMMAAKIDLEGGKTGGCCGGKGKDGGCCKSQKESTNVSGSGKITLPSLPSLGLSCAEAYQTLSSHKNFEKAADDMNSWLPKLKATSPSNNAGGKAGTLQPGRMPVEVEAASIMSVLKEFDIRFGKEA